MSDARLEPFPGDVDIAIVSHNGRATLPAVLLPAGLFALWLKPIVDETVSHRPDAAEQARSIAHYGRQLDVIDSTATAVSRPAAHNHPSLTIGEESWPTSQTATHPAAMTR